MLPGDNINPSIEQKIFFFFFFLIDSNIKFYKINKATILRRIFPFHVVIFPSYFILIKSIQI